MKHKDQKLGSRKEKRSAAWGKRMAAVALLLVAEMAFGQEFDARGHELPLSPKIAAELNRELSMARQGQGKDNNIRVIVQYRQAPRGETLSRVQNLGGRFKGNLDLVKAAAFSVPASALAVLENDPEVQYVSIDHPVQATDDLTNDAMNVAAAWTAGYDGSGIGVAIIDSGVADHFDFWNKAGTASRILYHQDFTGASERNTAGALVYDTYGHGTHVAGILGGSGYKSGGIYPGVATNVNLIDLRVLDGNGNGSDSNVIAALQKAIALKGTYNIRVINLSLGRGIYASYAQDPICQAVESAWKAGIVVVAAAGNYGRISVEGSNGYGTVAAPGNDPFVITVGAMKSMGTASRTDDQIASYSSKGPTTYDHVVKPDLVAPGNMVVSVSDTYSTLQNEYPGNLISGNSGDYFMLSGTSMATPAATGAIVLLLQAHPTLTPDQVKARLMKTAHKAFPVSTVATDPSTGQTYTSYYDMFTVGAGYLDIGAALANSDLAPSTVGAALSPTAAYNSSTKKVTLTNGNSTVAGGSVVWGSTVVWGTSVVWGSNVSGSTVVWGTSVVWGASTSTGFSVVWGSTTTAADSVVWGTATSSTDAAYAAVVGEN